MKYIVLNKLIYALELEHYTELKRLLSEYEVAKKKAADTNDEWEYEYEANCVFNYLLWIEWNIKPVSEVADNLDEHRYDKVCQKCIEKEDLPF